MKRISPAIWLVLIIVIIFIGALFYAFTRGTFPQNPSRILQGEDKNIQVTQNLPVTYGQVTARKDNTFTIKKLETPGVLKTGNDTSSKKTSLLLIYNENTSFIKVSVANGSITKEEIGNPVDIKTGTYVITDPVQEENGTITPAIVRYSEKKPY